MSEKDGIRNYSIAEARHLELLAINYNKKDAIDRIVDYYINAPVINAQVEKEEVVIRHNIMIRAYYWLYDNNKLPSTSKPLKKYDIYLVIVDEGDEDIHDYTIDSQYVTTVNSNNFDNVKLEHINLEKIRSNG